MAETLAPPIEDIDFRTDESGIAGEDEVSVGLEHETELAPDVQEMLDRLDTSNSTSFDLKDGQWVGSYESPDGKTQEISMLEHDPELRLRVEALEVGDYIRNELETEDENGQPVVYVSVYLRTESGITTFHDATRAESQPEEEKNSFGLESFGFDDGDGSYEDSDSNSNDRDILEFPLNLDALPDTPASVRPATPTPEVTSPIEEQPPASPELLAEPVPPLATTTPITQPSPTVADAGAETLGNQHPEVAGAQTSEAEEAVDPMPAVDTPDQPTTGFQISLTQSPGAWSYSLVKPIDLPKPTQAKAANEASPPSFFPLAEKPEGLWQTELASQPQSPVENTETTELPQAEPELEPTADKPHAAAQSEPIAQPSPPAPETIFAPLAPSSPGSPGSPEPSGGHGLQFEAAPALLQPSPPTPERAQTQPDTLITVSPGSRPVSEVAPMLQPEAQAQTAEPAAIAAIIKPTETRAAAVDQMAPEAIAQASSPEIAATASVDFGVEAVPVTTTETALAEASEEASAPLQAKNPSLQTMEAPAQIAEARPAIHQAEFADHSANQTAEVNTPQLTEGVPHLKPEVKTTAVRPKPQSASLANNHLEPLPAATVSAPELHVLKPIATKETTVPVTARAQAPAPVTSKQQTPSPAPEIHASMPAFTKPEATVAKDEQAPPETQEVAAKPTIEAKPDGASLKSPDVTAHQRVPDEKTAAPAFEQPTATIQIKQHDGELSSLSPAPAAEHTFQIRAQTQSEARKQVSRPDKIAATTAAPELSAAANSAPDSTQRHRFGQTNSQHRAEDLVVFSPPISDDISIDLSEETTERRRPRSHRTRSTRTTAA